MKPLVPNDRRMHTKKSNKHCKLVSQQTTTLITYWVGVVQNAHSNPAPIIKRGAGGGPILVTKF